MAESFSAFIKEADSSFSAPSAIETRSQKRPALREALSAEQKLSRIEQPDPHPN
jgi:hypothetical protein